MLLIKSQQAGEPTMMPSARSTIFASLLCRSFGSLYIVAQLPSELNQGPLVHGWDNIKDFSFIPYRV